MYSPSLLSLDVTVTNWKVSGGTQLTSSKYDTILDKFTGCELMFAAGKNAAQNGTI